jgi:hypothetical protein
MITKKYTISCFLLLILFGGSLMYTACNSVVGNIEIDDENLSFVVMPNRSVLAKPASVTYSPYGCFMTMYLPNESKPYRFWSIYLYYPKGIENQAGDLKAHYKYRAYDDNGQLTHFANCIIPGTKSGFQLVEKLLRKQENPQASRVTINGRSAAKPLISASSGIMGCYDGGNEPNGEGFVCGPGGCWADAEKTFCWYEGDQSYGLPEAEVICEGDCGGSPPPPCNTCDPEPDPWEPPDDNGGSTDPCTECNPGDNPDQECDDSEIVGPDGECLENCESGQYDLEGKCLDD